jgi:hypothetical protein
VQGWPVHKSDWKREILRGVVSDDGRPTGGDWPSDDADRITDGDEW